MSGDEAGENGQFPRRDWVEEVTNGDTSLGYWAWVDVKVEEHDDTQTLTWGQAKDLAGRVLAEIDRLIDEGTIPYTVADFSTLHDFVDANVLGGEEIDELGIADWNKVSSVVDEKLRERGGRPPVIRTYTVTVIAATDDLADRVMDERCGPEEDLGFQYTLTYENA